MILRTSWEVNQNGLGCIASERLSFTRLGKAFRGKPRSKPESGNPTFRDCRGARGNVTFQLLHGARASALSRLAPAIPLTSFAVKTCRLGLVPCFRDLSNAMDEVWGWDLSVVAEYRPEPWFRRDRSSQTGVPIYFTTSMNSHGIYSVNLPD